MLASRWLWSVSVALVLLGPCETHAQESQTAPRPLDEILAARERVEIRTTGGRTVIGIVDSVSPSAVSLTSLHCPVARLPSGPTVASSKACPTGMTLALVDIEVIERRYHDSVRDGALIGFGSAWVLNFALLPFQDWDGDGGAWLGYWGKFSLITAGLGALLDGQVEGGQEVYRRGGDQGRVGFAITPLARRSAVGWAVHLRF